MHRENFCSTFARHANQPLVPLERNVNEFLIKVAYSLTCNLALHVSIGCTGKRANTPAVAPPSIVGSEEVCSPIFGTYRLCTAAKGTLMTQPMELGSTFLLHVLYKECAFQRCVLTQGALAPRIECMQ